MENWATASVHGCMRGCARPWRWHGTPASPAGRHPVPAPIPPLPSPRARPPPWACLGQRDGGVNVTAGGQALKVLQRGGLEQLQVALQPRDGWVGIEWMPGWVPGCNGGPFQVRIHMRACVFWGGSGHHIMPHPGLGRHQRSGGRWVQMLHTRRRAVLIRLRRLSSQHRHRRPTLVQATHILSPAAWRSLPPCWSACSTASGRHRRGPSGALV